MISQDKLPIPATNMAEPEPEKPSAQLFATDDLIPAPEAIYVDLPPWDKEGAIEFLRYLREDGDEQEQRETFEYLVRVLDEDRMSYRKLFPEELKGVTW